MYEDLASPGVKDRFAERVAIFCDSSSMQVVWWTIKCSMDSNSKGGGDPATMYSSDRRSKSFVIVVLVYL